MSTIPVPAVLLDARADEATWAAAIKAISTADTIGLDVETQDSNCHAGLTAFNNGTRHVFDHRRTVMCGFSVWAEGSGIAYYVNLSHADVENRLPAEKALTLLAARKPGAIFVCHNAPFELVMFKQCLDVDLTDVVCSLQLAVSAHGPDEYDVNRFRAEPLNGFYKLMPNVLSEFKLYDPETRGRSLTPAQSELLGKFIGKTSKAAHSYNGYVDNLTYGYSLKKLSASLFGAKQTTYKEVLAGRAHMGELTGEETCSYGASDAYWCVRVYRTLIDRLMVTNPALIETFFAQENPMIYVYADVWREGIQLNMAEVYKQQGVERENMARVLRDLKAEIKTLLPFPLELNDILLEKQDKWYPKNGAKKRKAFEDWCALPDVDDAYAQCAQSRNPISVSWAAELGKPAPAGVNIGYYFETRVLLHDLMGHKLVYTDGAVTSDADARARMLKTFEHNGQETHVRIMKLLHEMAQIENRMKLYITGYAMLMDPDTGRVYPSLSSMLASRRMAMSFPNTMALAKSGESAYVRGFYLGDTDDHVVISADWSSIELVEIGDQSEDPEFRKVFGQLPYGDLHSGAAADALSIKTLPGITEEEFKLFKYGENPEGRVLKDKGGADITPEAYFKWARTKVGKVSNFNFWYSGSLSTVGEELNWSVEEMWTATSKYKERFAVAEAWRVARIDEARAYGFVTLPDQHRRVRFESTMQWRNQMLSKFADLDPAPAMLNYAELAIKRIQSRSGNQIVNSIIQGTCATLAKRSILKLRETMDHKNARFLTPIHDELVYSVHRDYAPEFIPMLRRAMTYHPDIVKTLPLDCTIAVGKTFRPYDLHNPALSQIELDEATPIDNVIPLEFRGKKLNDDLIRKVISFCADAKLAA